MAGLARELMRASSHALLPGDLRARLADRLSAWRGAPRVAVAGCGVNGRAWAASCRRLGGVRLVALSDPRSLPLGQAVRFPARAFRSLDRMLAATRPHLLCVCTAGEAFVETVEIAVAAGVRTLLCEPESPPSRAELCRAAAACEAAGVRLVGGSPLRHEPEWLRAAEVVRRGGLGRLRAVSAFAGSPVEAVGAALVDAVRMVLGGPRIVGATFRVEGGGTAEGALELEDGMRVALCFSDAPNAVPRLMLEGELGTVAVQPGRLTASAGVHLVSARRGGDGRSEQMRALIRQAVAEPLEDWLAAVEAARVIARAALSGRRAAPVAVEKAASLAEAATVAIAPAGRGLAVDGGAPAVRRWFTSDPAFGVREWCGAARVLASRRLDAASGPETRRLEREWAAAYQAPLARACGSHAAALQLALALLQAGGGDEVITAAIGEVEAVAAILLAGCTPVFADVAATTGNLTAATIAARITPRTRAVVLAHLLGRPAEEVGVIAAMCARRGIALIEDCAHAHLAEHRGRLVGSFGAAGIFSLGAGEQITSGGGGILVVNAAAMAERAERVAAGEPADRSLLLGLSPGLGELQAAVARAQLARLPRLIARRRDSAETLVRHLRQVDGVIPPPRSPESRPAWSMLAFALDVPRLGVGVDDVFCALRAEGVRVRRRVQPGPLAAHPAVRELLGGVRLTACAAAQWPDAAAFLERTMVIPWSSRVGERHVEAIAAAFRKVTAHCPRELGGNRTAAAAPLLAESA